MFPINVCVYVGGGVSPDASESPPFLPRGPRVHMVFIAGSNGRRRVLMRTENMGIDWHWRVDKLYGTLTGVAGEGVVEV